MLEDIPYYRNSRRNLVWVNTEKSFDIDAASYMWIAIQFQYSLYLPILDDFWRKSEEEVAENDWI